MNLKEQIGIYQDSANKKTTIVIYNMTQKTRDKIATLLLGDLKVVEEITGLKEVSRDDSCISPDLTGMTPVEVKSNTRPEIPEMPAEKEISNEPADIPVSTESYGQEDTESQRISSVVEDHDTASAQEPEKKKRGRPRKDKSSNQVAESESNQEISPIPTVEPVSETEFSSAVNPPMETETMAEIQPDVTVSENPEVTEPVKEEENLSNTEDKPAEISDPCIPVFTQTDVSDFQDDSLTENALITDYPEMPEDMLAAQNEACSSNVYEDASVENAGAKVRELWQSYDENHPAALLYQLVDYWQNGVQDEKVAAAMETDKLMELVAVNRRRIQSLFWEFQHCEPFTKALMSAIRQKGMGDGLLVGSQEYMGAIVGTLNILSDEELMVLAKGAAKNMLEALNPMFNLS
ncbi:MAG: hypothetical protein IJO13_11630 [Lachnospiraceae bacterium]|nr:hypothetical protein [Lachnospiraceae bacterium]